MAAEGDAGGMTGYIKHHLEHLTVSVGDSPFMTLNIDSIFFKLLLAVLFLFFFIRVARRATAGVPGKLQCAIEMMVEAMGLAGAGWSGEDFTDEEREAGRIYLRIKSSTIAGGSSEVQSNIISKRILGLPDPSSHTY